MLDGGGVKGAALVGCLKAAEDAGIDFIGYGGTSAGSIVALLASLGYTATEMHDIIVEQDFSSLLDDDGRALTQLRNSVQNSSGMIRALASGVSNYGLIKQLMQNKGLYDGAKFKDFLWRLCTRKFPSWKHKADITFLDLEREGCLPLKIVASDLRTRAPVVCCASNGNGLSGSIFDAVRASMSYPFVFVPVPVGDRYLVDGGLSSNLPMFLFEEERVESRYPIIAFDLIAPPNPKPGPYSFLSFCSDMLSTALESGEHVQRGILRDLYHIPVVVPRGINTLDFSLNESAREHLYLSGFNAATEFFRYDKPYWPQVESQVEALQALHAPEHLVSPVLRALTQDMELMYSADRIRANVSLPTGHGTRLITYQYRMDDDADRHLELPLRGGISGLAWEEKSPAYGELPEDVIANEEWGLTRQQCLQIPEDRRAVIAVPIFDRARVKKLDVKELPLLGVLSIDTSTPLEQTDWLDRSGRLRGDLVDLLVDWADVLTRVLR